MKPKCVFQNCANIISTRAYDNKFFKFPISPNEKEKWIINCGLDASLNYKNKVLCGKHSEGRP